MLARNSHLWSLLNADWGAMKDDTIDSFTVYKNLQAVFMTSGYTRNAHQTVLIQPPMQYSLPAHLEVPFHTNKGHHQHSLAPPYLSDQLQQATRMEPRQHLRSSSSPALVVPATRRLSLGDRAFLVAAARAWNSLPSTVTAASTLHSFRRALKTHLFTASFPIKGKLVQPCSPRLLSGSKMPLS